MTDIERLIWGAVAVLVGIALGALIIGIPAYRHRRKDESAFAAASLTRAGDLGV